MSAFKKFWDTLPAPLRTIINVAAGAALAAAVTYLVGVISGGSFDPSVFLTVILTAVGTAVVRSVNPADTSYGVGSTSKPTI